MDDAWQELSRVDAADRVLLISHCLRPSQSCPGKFSKQGLACPSDCGIDCAVGRFREAALTFGYKGVCIAAGGAMALRFVKEQAPRGIVAVACTKELAEGFDAVQQMAEHEDTPTIVAVPLSADGCVDTSVDERRVQEVIGLGCSTS